MSEVMLHGVLNMPIDIWSDDHLSKIQRHSRYVEASELIRNQDAEIDQLRQQLEAAEAEVKRLKSAWHVETLSRKDQLIAEQEAENDRLKQIIREASEQKPFAWCWKHASGSVEPVLFKSELEAIADCHSKSADGDAIGVYLNPAPPQSAAIPEYNGNVPADCLSPTVAKARRYGDPKNILSAAPEHPAAIPEYYQEEWKRNVMLMWSCVRKHDSSIPSDVLDFMREFLLSAAPKPEGK